MTARKPNKPRLSMAGGVAMSSSTLAHIAELEAKAKAEREHAYCAYCAAGEHMEHNPEPLA